MNGDGLGESCMYYNKTDGYVPTLVGNWVEERYLARRTGIHRLPGRDTAQGSKAANTAEPARDAEPLAAKSAAAPAPAAHPRSGAGRLNLSTLPRTVEHDAQYLAAEWLSTSAVVHQPPDDRLGDLVRYRPEASEGPRQAREAAALLAKARTLVPPRHDIPWQRESMYRSQFQDSGPSATPLGKAQMQTQDRGPVQRDADFLAETRTLPRNVADRYARPGGTAVTPHAATLPGDAAVTIYSEALAAGKHGADVYGSARYGPTEFGKHSNFTKVVGDYTKDTSNE